MAHSRLVKDVMVPAVRLPSNSYAIDALRSMMEAHAEYGVICDESGSPSSIISRAQLQVAKPDEIIQAFATHIPYPVTVRSDDSLSGMIQMLAENIAHTYDSADIIVQMGDAIEGIVPHKAIERYILDIPVNFPKRKNQVSNSIYASTIRLNSTLMICCQRVWAIFCWYQKSTPMTIMVLIL